MWFERTQYWDILNSSNSQNNMAAAENTRIIQESPEILHGALEEFVASFNVFLRVMKNNKKVTPRIIQPLR